MESMRKKVLLLLLVSRLPYIWFNTSEYVIVINIIKDFDDNMIVDGNIFF